MDWPLTTRCVLLGVTILLVGYDLAALWFGGRDGTISVVLYDFCKEHPIAALALGIILGHIFWKH